MVKGNAIVVIVCGTEDSKWIFYTDGKLQDYVHFNRVMVGKVLLRLLARGFREKVEVMR